MSRLSVQIDTETNLAIRKMMEEGLTATEVVRRAISCYSYVKSEQDSGARVKITAPEHRPSIYVEFQ